MGEILYLPSTNRTYINGCFWFPQKVVLQPPKRQYISGIYCQLGDYIPPDPTFYGSQKQPLTKKSLGFQRRSVFVWCVNSCKKPLFLRIFHEQIQGTVVFTVLELQGMDPNFPLQASRFLRQSTWFNLGVAGYTTFTRSQNLGSQRHGGFFLGGAQVVTRKKTLKVLEVFNTKQWGERIFSCEFIHFLPRRIPF